MSDYQKCEAHPSCKFHKCDCHSIHLMLKTIEKVSSKKTKIKGFKIEDGKIKTVYEKRKK